ncbi:metallophosphoesterase [Stigmatella aurantiaca]|uniref:metallophosphoesterase n=1 Tax=Stigmatella aurantiaca TaxID=41 RepID=UPI0009F18783|nr:metallophosphoesterase [Stigmatella aurantiaca]
MRTWKVAAVLFLAGCAGACGGAEAEEGPRSTGRAELACPGLAVPVYHRIKPDGGDSLYTVNANEASNASTKYGYTEDRGVAFQASAATASGLSPVYRLYSPEKKDHLWTIDANEKASAAANHGYTVDEGTGFYASKTPGDCLIPVYRFVSPTLLKHRFATTEAERSSLSAAGWTAEGIKFYATAAVAPPEESDTQFTLVVIPDTQQEIVYRPELFTNRVQWLASNKGALDIRFVTHTGDMVDWDTSDHLHYARASDAVTVLDTARIPYAFAIGNHDTAAVCQGGSACPGNVNANLRNTTTFNQYFPTSRFTALAGVYEAGKIDNAYHTFTAGGLSWLVLNLELWPRTGAVNWAKTVLEAHPRHNVILITHSHLTSSSGIEQTQGGYGNNSPQYVFDNLIKQYANVRFVFSGHVGKAGYREDTGVKGNKIYQFLNCYHDGATNPTRLVEIDTAANTAATRVYAPMTNEEKQDGSKRTISNIAWVR